MSNEQRVQMSEQPLQVPSRLDIAASRALGARLEDGPSMASLRAAAARTAAEKEMPRPVERPWKYLDVTNLSLDGYRPGLDADHGAEAAMRARIAGGEESALILQQNSETVAIEIAPGHDVQVVDFASADDSQQSTITARLAAGVPAARSKLTALHYAFLRGGLLIDVPSNVELAKPVRIVRSAVEGRQLVTPHTLIVTGANSRVTVIEEHWSSDEDIVALPVTEIFPGPGAEVRYTVLHRWGAATRVFAEQRTITERGASVVSLGLVTGGAVVKSHIESSLTGRGSSSELLGLCVGDARQHVDFHTVQDHIAADTRSDLLFKSALKDHSRSVYYGLTRVGLEARNADANQENRNLLLSKTAKADSDPVLEILTNNVIRASHGATAGPVDEEQLYYLQTRGLSHAQAEALLVRGFLNQVLDRVPDTALRAELEVALEAKLGGHV